MVNSVCSLPVRPAPKRWKLPCAASECTLHQLSPYIGKIKSSIAGELIERYSLPGDLVVDPFAGSGTIPLEAAIRGRRVFGADVSPYACVLSKAKLFPPPSLQDALDSAYSALNEAAQLPKADLRQVPSWVRRFFHPKTLKEVISLATVCRRPGNEFLLACLLGILHHQRPGFLSFPSSHLVPYLRDRKYPRETFPEMYEYRELRPRLLAKIARAYRRFAMPPESSIIAFETTPVQRLSLPRRFGAVVTSPPYMNALDYGRDNRLRLWFIAPSAGDGVDNDVTQRRQAFVDAIASLAGRLEAGLKVNGHCVFIVGEEFRRSFQAHPSEVVVQLMRHQAPRLRFKAFVSDQIPDVRRSRKGCNAVKTEHVLVFQKK